MKPKASFEQVSTEALLPFLLELLSENKAVNMTVTGNSMMPLWRDRVDSVILKKPDRIKNLDVVLYVQDNGQAILHRIIKCRKEGYYIVGDNQIDVDGPIRADQIKAVVTDFWRSGKLYSCRLWWCRLYAFVWGHGRAIRPVLLPLTRLGKGIVKRMK
ncbi:MAG: hypothetical protein E7400_03380 [Ruminococcaceae bacterium]|nr:hypothetical protein [Oscillospiraceae bacterium]